MAYFASPGEASRAHTGDVADEEAGQRELLRLAKDAGMSDVITREVPSELRARLAADYGALGALGVIQRMQEALSNMRALEQRVDMRRVRELMLAGHFTCLGYTKLGMAMSWYKVLPGMRKSSDIQELVFYFSWIILWHYRKCGGQNGVAVVYDAGQSFLDFNFRYLNEAMKFSGTFVQALGHKHTVYWVVESLSAQYYCEMARPMWPAVVRDHIRIVSSSDVRALVRDLREMPPNFPRGEAGVDEGSSASGMFTPDFDNSGDYARLLAREAMGEMTLGEMTTVGEFERKRGRLEARNAVLEQTLPGKTTKTSSSAASCALPREPRILKVIPEDGEAGETEEDKKDMKESGGLAYVFSSSDYESNTSEEGGRGGM